ncbi:MAG: gamma carbonic anhydrase family protein [Betaproteobacteria bacterium]|nr:gamma carbonic anhydrase family protein [Betaproteobacteria bacterium]
MILLPYQQHEPRIAAGVSAHASAAVIGRTELKSGCTLGELTLVRADGEDVRIGSDCWFGEASTVHIADRVFPAVIGSHVTVGRYGLVHACTVADDCVIGEHAAVMDGSVVGPGAVIAAQSIVPPGKKLEGGWLYAGAPARPVERVSPALLKELHEAIRSGVGTKVAHILAPARLHRLRHTPGTGVNHSFGEGVYVAPTASIAGRVVLGPRASVWFGVEIDSGEATVEIGEETNVQDNSRLYGGKPGEDIRIGPRVVIGHNVRIFPSLIEADAIIGMEAIIGEGTVVRAGACVAAGSITEPGTEVAAGQVWSGRPARAARPLSERNREEFGRAVEVYIEYAANYLACATQARRAAGSRSQEDADTTAAPCGSHRRAGWSPR